jgi:urease accessory protein
MYVTEPSAGLPPFDRPVIPAFVRTHSVLRADLASVADRTSALRIREEGALRLRFPKVSGACEGIILNTAGGIAGGDRQELAFSLDEGACASLTTQSAEKVYGSDGELASIATMLALAANADLAWLPQEAILFDRARLSRRLDVDMPASASITIKEGVVFGRTARGEVMTGGLFHDRWRIRRGGQLIFAEDVRLDGAIANRLRRPALGNGACAIATIVHVSPDATARLEQMRDALAGAVGDAGVSAWNGMLVVRLAGAEPHVVRATSARVLSLLLPRVSPRIWSC